MSNKYSQNILDSAKKSTIDAVKTCFKKSNSETAEAFGDLIDNTIADKITSISKCLNELHSKTDKSEKEIPKETYISPEKKTTNY